MEAKHVSIVALRFPIAGYVIRRCDENFRLLPGSPDVEVEMKVFDNSTEAQEAYPDAVIDALNG